MEMIDFTIYTSELSKFYFEYYDRSDSDCQLVPHYHELVHWCTSVFWIEQQWIFELIIDVNKITSSIHPKRYLLTTGILFYY